LPANATSHRDGGLTAGTTYTYTVRAVNADGVSEWSSGATATPANTPPSTPRNLTVYPASSSASWGSDEIAVYWNLGLPVTNTDRYRLERSLDEGATWLTAAYTSLADNWFSDIGPAVIPDRTVCYRVSAVNVAGESPPTAPKCTAVPAQPTILSWTEAEGMTEITWTDNSSLEEGYEIRTYALMDGYWVIATLPPNSTTWRGSLDPGYLTTVVAIKDGGPYY
jgi:hypothetical protein